MRYLFYLIIAILIIQPLNSNGDYFVDEFSKLSNMIAFGFVALALLFSKKHIDYFAVAIILFIGTLFFILCLQAIIFSPAIGPGIRFLNRIFFPLSFYILGASFTFYFKDPKLIFRAATLILILVLISQVIGIFIGVPWTDPAYAHAAVGVAKHPAITAALLVAIVPIVFYRAVQGNWWWFVFTGLSIIATFRRSAWLFLAIFVFAFIAFHFMQGRKLHKNITRAIVVGFVISPFIYFVPTSFYDLFISRIFETGTGAKWSGAGRTEFWEIILQALYNADEVPRMIGFGVGQIEELLLSSMDTAIGGHNDFLDITYSFGLIGLGSLSILWLSFYRVSFRTSNDRTKVYTLRTSFFALLVFSMSTGGVFDPQFCTFFFFIGWLVNATTPVGPSLKETKNVLVA